MPPLAIVVCGCLDKTLEGTEQEFWIQDCSAATENILLMAHSSPQSVNGKAYSMSVVARL